MTATRALFLSAALVLVGASCAAAVTTSPPIPTSTTIATAGSPCAPVLVAPGLFENYVPVVPSPSVRPAFSATDFTGLGKVLSVGSDALVLELADAQFRVYGPTTVKVGSSTNFDRKVREWALVAAGGVAAGATEVPLAPGAPAIDASQRVVLECHRGAGPVTGEGLTVANTAAAGSSAWTASKGLGYAWPAGTMIWYERVVHYGSLSDLHLVPGQSVYVEFAGTAGNYEAKKLTTAGVSFGYRG